MKRSFLQLAATGCLVSSASLADTVSLANGDRLSGTLARMETDSLVFETPYAGKLKLPWAQVSRIGTDAPVRLADGTELDGQLRATDARQLRIRIGSLAETMPLALDRIAAINLPRSPDKTVTSARDVRQAERPDKASVQTIFSRGLNHEHLERSGRHASVGRRPPTASTIGGDLWRNPG